MTISEDKLNVFISYSWDSDEHKNWIQELANNIENAGANVLFDQKDLKPGAHIKLFMERVIVSSDIVLLILTENYKNKAENRQGGAGYEYNVINTNLYECLLTNEKYFPVLRSGSYETSVPLFLKEITYIDLRDGKSYNQNLKQLLSLISESPLKQYKKCKMETKYKETNVLKKGIQSNFENYFTKFFGQLDDAETVSSSGIKLKSNKSRTIKNIRKIIKDWEKEIVDYRDLLKNVFSDKKFNVYEENIGAFKSKVFRNELWTVNSAMRTKDPDLARYKKHFSDALPEDIFDTVKNIIDQSNSYVNDETRVINYKDMLKIKDLKMDFLDSEDMFLNQIIGYGIRSEILHRLHPAYFPIMTQRSLWGMYFLTDNEDEFITIEKKNRIGLARVSHNWQYEYARFTYYNNIVANLFLNKLSELKIELKQELWFGYVNLFLREISIDHKADIKALHEWAEV